MEQCRYARSPEAARLAGARQWQSQKEPSEVLGAACRLLLQAVFRTHAGDRADAWGRVAARRLRSERQRLPSAVSTSTLPGATSWRWSNAARTASPGTKVLLWMRSRIRSNPCSSSVRAAIGCLSNIGRKVKYRRHKKWVKSLTSARDHRRGIQNRTAIQLEIPPRFMVDS